MSVSADIVVHTLAVARRHDRIKVQMTVQRAEEGRGNSNASELGPGHYSARSSVPACPPCLGDDAVRL